jgi:hypothetical protein
MFTLKTFIVNSDDVFAVNSGGLVWTSISEVVNTTRSMTRAERMSASIMVSFFVPG